MNIYQKDGAVDLDLALEELRATRPLSNQIVQRMRIAEISAAALLDIAASLRPIAAEAALAMPALLAPADPEDDDQHDYLGVGDLVHVVDTERSGQIIELGFDGDGETIARVVFGDNSAAMTYYARQLERLVGDERPHVSTPEEDAEMIDADDAPELFADTADGGDYKPTEAELDAHESEKYGSDPVEPEELVDDIDADFDGDAHAEAEAAIERLKANEAKRKAAKKTATKKGKK